MTQSTYENNQIWQRVQDYLPFENRLNKNELPQQEWVEMNDIKIHIDHYIPRRAKAIIVVLHGVGGNGRLLSFIAKPLWENGYEVVCPDMPMYGHTAVNGKVTYEDWVKVSVYVSEKYMSENIPFYLFGLSAGGMLAYQTACRLKKVTGLMTTCLLDQRISEVTMRTASSKVMAVIGKKFLKLTHRVFGKLKLPMKAVCNMKAIVNNEQLAKLMMQDPLSSGAKVSLGFMHGLLNPKIEIEARDFYKCPVLLVHPQLDYWTDIALSRLFFDELPCIKDMKILEGAGHFPIEHKGLKQLEAYCIAFIESMDHQTDDRKPSSPLQISL